MFLSLTRLPLLTWAPLALVLFCGCSSTPQEVEQPKHADDFEDDLEPPRITKESVSGTMMMHRRARIEPTIGVVTPNGDMNAGLLLGIKGEIEALKNVFWGLSFDWANQSISDPVNASNSATAEPAQFYDNLDRYNLLITLKYDLLIEKDFLEENTPLSLRFGFGMGSIIVQGETAAFVAQTGAQVDMFIGFLARPSLDVHWQVWDHGRVLLGLAYDIVYPNTLEIRTGTETRQISGDIDFNTFILRAGFVFEF